MLEVLAQLTREINLTPGFQRLQDATELVLLAAGDKSGVGETPFYHEQVRRPDLRFDAHESRLKRKRG